MVMKRPCKNTHGFILEGTCPWCDCQIIAGKPVLDSGDGTSAIKRWNIPALIAALDHEDKEIRMAVVSDMLCHGFKSEETLPVLREALSNSYNDVRWLATNALTRRGTELSVNEADRFEKEVQHNPNNSVLRILLLGHYFLRASLFESARKARQEHIIWIIENNPELALLGGPDTRLDPSTDGEVYKKAKQLWLRQVEVNEGNLIILENAARHFSHSEPELSEVLLKKAQALEPNNPEWSKRLGDVYELGLRSRTGESRRETATQSFAEFEKAFNGETDELKRFWMLPDLSKTAFEAGELERAQVYATELLVKTTQPNYFFRNNGPAIHYGNLVLGRLALRSGDVGKAKAYLIEAGKTTGSPALCTGGPNMMLAKELLERGERETVIQYLKLCTNFWQTRDHRAEQWIYIIEQGGVPDFGPNLDY